MLDIKFIRENPDAVRENIKKKFQDAKLPLVDEVLDLDSKRRAAIAEADQLRSNRNTLSKQIGMLMGQAKKDPAKLAEAEAVKQQVKEQADRLAELEKQETELEEKLHHNMLLIPQMIDSSVPIGKDDSENVEVQRFGACEVPDFPIPYHVDIMESFNGIDLDAAGRVSGSGFYYLLGDIARLHEAVLAYGRGGACESVLPGRTGYWFKEQTVESLADCIERFERDGVACSKEEIREHSRSFSEERFERELKEYCLRRMADWQQELLDCSHWEKEELD